NVQGVDPSRGGRSLPVEVEPSPPGRTGGEARRREVVRDGEGEGKALPAAVLTQVPESLGQAPGGPRPGHSERPPSEGEASRGPGLEPEQCPYQLALPGAYQTGDADHLPAAEFES